LIKNAPYLSYRMQHITTSVRPATVHTSDSFNSTVDHRAHYKLLLFYVIALYCNNATATDSKLL